MKPVRLALVSMMASACLSPLAGAQTPPAASPPDAMAPAAPTPAAPAPAAPAPTAPATPGAAAPEAPVAPTLTPQAPPPPPAPPAPPTDPTAIAMLKTLEDVCIPAASHGDKDLGKAAKADGYRKNGDNWVYKGAGFQFTLLPPGSNPNDCQMQIVHPVDPNPATPAAPLVTALHNWATFGHGWNLVSNYKNTQGTEVYFTRTWEHQADGRNEALVLTTVRKAQGDNGAPESRAGDTSTMIYSNHPA